MVSTKQLVKDKFRTAELKSTGQLYYISSASGILGVYSYTPELAWLSAWRHVCSM